MAGGDVLGCHAGTWPGVLLIVGRDGGVAGADVRSPVEGGGVAGAEVRGPLKVVVGGGVAGAEVRGCKRTDSCGTTIGCGAGTVSGTGVTTAGACVGFLK